MARHDQRAYRVRGRRPDGSWKYKDFFQLSLAEERATRWLKPHNAGGRVEAALTNVTIIRSAPIRWLYEKDNDNAGSV
jgi:hypothetical protein